MHSEADTYALDDVGSIDTITHEDGALWDYLYDARYRLTSATRSNHASPNETIQAAYTYTYDDGENLLTRVVPWEDDFGDGLIDASRMAYRDRARPQKWTASHGTDEISVIYGGNGENRNESAFCAF